MVFVPASDNRWVSEEYARLAEIVKDYDPYLELRWIPPEHRTRDDKKPYVVVDTRTETPVIYASELDTPQYILSKIFEGDNKHGDVLRRMEAQNAAAEAFEYKKKMDMYEEASDYAQFLLRSPLNTLRFKGKKFDDERRVIGTAKGEKYL